MLTSQFNSSKINFTVTSLVHFVLKITAKGQKSSLLIGVVTAF